MTSSVSRFSFSVRNLAVGLLLVAPVFVLGFFVYNPPEQKALKQDKARQDTINVLARALEPQYKKDGAYPATLGVLEFTPPELERYIYRVSEDGQNMIVYTDAESLAWKEYCQNTPAKILYSSKDSRTAIVCGASPSPGSQDFVN